MDEVIRIDIISTLFAYIRRIMNKLNEKSKNHLCGFETSTNLTQNTFNAVFLDDIIHLRTKMYFTRTSKRKDLKRINPVTLLYTLKEHFN